MLASNWLKFSQRLWASTILTVQVYPWSKDADHMKNKRKRNIWFKALKSIEDILEQIFRKGTEQNFKKNCIIRRHFIHNLMSSRVQWTL